MFFFKANNRLLKIVLAIFIIPTVLAQPARAQWDLGQLDDTFNEFGRYFAQFCAGVEQVDGYVDTGETIGAATSWVCALQPSIQRAQAIVEGFSQDLNGFFSGGLGDTFASVLDATGIELGDPNLQGLLTQGLNDIGTGNFSMEEWAGKLLGETNIQLLENLTKGPDAGVAELEADVVNADRKNPIRMDRELSGMRQRSATTMQMAEAQDAVRTSQGLAASSIARGDEQRLLNRVTSPNPGAKGTADLAQQRGKEANSSRAAIQGMVQAQADYMRQAAVSTNNLVTAVKENAAQQVYTTQQLGTLAKQIGDEQLQQYNEWRSEYYRELGESVAEGKQTRSNFMTLAELLRGANAGGAE